MTSSGLLDTLTGRTRPTDIAEVEAEFLRDRDVDRAQERLDDARARGRQIVQAKSALPCSDTLSAAAAEAAIRAAQRDLHEAVTVASRAIAPRIQALHAAQVTRMAATLTRLAAERAELEDIEAVARRCKVPKLPAGLSSPAYTADETKLAAFRHRAETQGIALE